MKYNLEITTLNVEIKIFILSFYYKMINEILSLLKKKRLLGGGEPKSFVVRK